MTDELVLYGNAGLTSPYVFSCFVTLEEKGVPFRLELLSLERKEHERAEYRDASWTGRVPALRHGDFWLAESSAIDEYVEDAFPPPRWPRLYPEDPQARARMRMVQAFLRSDLQPLRVERSTGTLFGEERAEPFSAEGKASADRFLRIADRLLPAGASFLSGSFSPADADLSLMLQRLLANGDPVPERLAAYARGIWARPSVRAWLVQTKYRGA
jgi:glutathione S-transferase